MIKKGFYVRKYFEVLKYYLQEKNIGNQLVYLIRNMLNILWYSWKKENIYNVFFDDIRKCLV